MTVAGSSPGPIAQVEVGMQVLDSDDEQLGNVSAMKMGDPEATTTQGQQQPRGLVGGVIDAFAGAEPDVPEQRAQQLLREGYIKIDAKGFFTSDLYAGGDEIDRVDGTTVRLSVPRRMLVPET